MNSTELASASPNNEAHPSIQQRPQYEGEAFPVDDSKALVVRMERKEERPILKEFPHVDKARKVAPDDAAGSTTSPSDAKWTKMDSSIKTESPQNNLMFPSLSHARQEESRLRVEQQIREMAELSKSSGGIKRTYLDIFRQGDMYQVPGRLPNIQESLHTQDVKATAEFVLPSIAQSEMEQRKPAQRFSNVSIESADPHLQVPGVRLGRLDSSTLAPPAVASTKPSPALPAAWANTPQRVIHMTAYSSPPRSNSSGMIDLTERQYSDNTDRRTGLTHSGSSIRPGYSGARPANEGYHTPPGMGGMNKYSDSQDNSISTDILSQSWRRPQPMQPTEEALSALGVPRAPTSIVPQHERPTQLVDPPRTFKLITRDGICFKTKQPLIRKEYLYKKSSKIVFRWLCCGSQAKDHPKESE